MRYEWDERKRRANLAKHGLDFADAEHFDWLHSSTEEDDSEAYGEARYQTIAPLDARMCVMIWTETERGVLRVISLRKATKSEIKRYYEDPQF